jgi:hypothetical protein
MAVTSGRLRPSSRALHDHDLAGGDLRVSGMVELPAARGAAAPMTWSDTFLAALKDNDVRLISYVPDNVLTPLIKG